MLPLQLDSWPSLALFASQTGVTVAVRHNDFLAGERPHLCDLQGNPVPLPQLLQLSDDTVRDAGLALSVQAVHHALHKIDLHEMTRD